MLTYCRQSHEPVTVCMTDCRFYGTLSGRLGMHADTWSPDLATLPSPFDPRASS